MGEGVTMSDESPFTESEERAEHEIRSAMDRCSWVKVRRWLRACGAPVGRLLNLEDIERAYREIGERCLTDVNLRRECIRHAVRLGLIKEVK
jgi:hypothetical protein